MDSALIEYEKEREEAGLRGKDAYYLLNMNREELLEFIRTQEVVLRKADALIEENGTIRKHWIQFNEYLDANEEFREEWDAFCMAMKLKEW